MSAKIKKFFSSYFFIISLALVLGVVLSDPARIYLAPYVAYFLGTILFFSTIKIDLRDVFGELKEAKTILIITFLMLVVFPLVVFLTTHLMAPQYAVPFLILAAMPAGMTAPFLAEISGGRQSLALVVTVITSLLAPFTIPLLLKLLAGEVVAVSYWDILISLATVIFIPFVLAQLVRWVGGIREIKKKYAKMFRTISLILLGLLVAGIISKQAEALLIGLADGDSLVTLGALIVLFVIFHIAGYYLVWWRDRRDRLTITVTLSYMNFTLAVYLVDTFFTDPQIVIPVVLSVIPWTLMFAPFKGLATN